LTLQLPLEYIFCALAVPVSRLFFVIRRGQILVYCVNSFRGFSEMVNEITRIKIINKITLINLHEIDGLLIMTCLVVAKPR